MTELQRRREAKGWRRAELSRRARINATTLGWIEERRFHPYLTQLRKLARALNVPALEANQLLREVKATRARKMRAGQARNPEHGAHGGASYHIEASVT